MATRNTLSPIVRNDVLQEAGYKCANPTCRNVLTLQVHHIHWVKDGGGDTVDNLLALCGHCHDLHTQGHIPKSAIVYWKGMLVALNHAFCKESTDLLLYLYKAGPNSIHRYTSDAALRFAGLIAADLVGLNFVGGPGDAPSLCQIVLTPKGRMLIEAWREGDEKKYRDALDL